MYKGASIIPPVDERDLLRWARDITQAINIQFFRGRVEENVAISTAGGQSRLVGTAGGFVTINTLRVQPRGSKLLVWAGNHVRYPSLATVTANVKETIVANGLTAQARSIRVFTQVDASVHFFSIITTRSRVYNINHLARIDINSASVINTDLMVFDLFQ